MPVTADRPAPYAPTSAILTLIERHRNRGLPSPINADVLARAGISDSLVPRTLQSLQTLDLVDEEGRPTQILEAIRLAPQAEYQRRLADWLTATYADALTFIDPATADETAIRDAFRSYKPTGMQSRMVSLFSGLFAAAGIAPEKPRQRQPARQPAARPPQKRTAAPPRRDAPQKPASIEVAQTAGSGLPPALAGLLASLPPEEHGWTREQRDRFVATFSAVLDFCFPLRERPRQEATQFSAEEET